MKKDEIIECLNDLLTKAYDAEEGFKIAAERAAGHPPLVSFFKRQSDMRLAFGHELKQVISLYDGTPDKGSSIAAKAHQIWIVVKDSLTPDHDGEAILEECIRGEKGALKDYDDKLECGELPADVHALISKQRAAIAASLVANEVKENAAD